MLDSELKSSDITLSKDVSDISQPVSEIKKQRKKFSILMVSPNNEAKLEIEGKGNTGSNNNLITFSRNAKAKKNLKTVLKDVNTDLEGITNDLRKSLSILSSSPAKKTNTFRKQTSNYNENYLKSSANQTGNYNNTYNNQQQSQRMYKNNQYNDGNSQPYSNNGGLSNEQLYLIAKENIRLKEHNRRLENELEDYKKYLDNMVKEKQ